MCTRVCVRRPINTLLCDCALICTYVCKMCIRDRLSTVGPAITMTIIITVIIIIIVIINE